MKNKKLNLILILRILLILFSTMIFSFILLLEFEIGILFFISAIIALILSVLGGILTRSAFKLSKKEKKLRCVLTIAGISALSILTFSVLHNIFYALAIVFSKFSMVFEILEVSSFLISVLIAPIIFPITAIYGLILLKKMK